MLLSAMLFASALAHAQYAWIDEKGVRHYSDQPPPTTTPDAKILKSPRGSMRPMPAPVAPEGVAATPAAAAPVKAAPTLAEREADYRKRHADADKSDKKAADEKNTADTRRAQCESAARNKAQFDTGRRLRTEQNTVMTEEDRARELGNIDKVLKDCK